MRVKICVAELYTFCFPYKFNSMDLTGNGLRVTPVTTLVSSTPWSGSMVTYSLVKLVIATLLVGFLGGETKT